MGFLVQLDGRGCVLVRPCARVLCSVCHRWVRFPRVDRNRGPARWVDQVRSAFLCPMLHS